MPDLIRFYVDEHVSHAIARQLAQNEIDVLTAQYAGMTGADDSDQLTFATNRGRIPVTFDDDFLVLHTADQEHAGIVYYSRRHRIGHVVEVLRLIHAVCTPEEMHSRVEYL